VRKGNRLSPPYRDEIQSRESLGATEVVRDAVTHVVRQFADPLAFYRELVQNAIDAGSTRIDVRIRGDSRQAQGGDSEAILCVDVHDDGCGMTRDVVERCLLVLFRSTKETDRTKIGKFGVGFYSVFAIEPRRVLVHTGTGPDAPGHRVRFLEELAYEVEETAPRTGTTVRLFVAVQRGEEQSFVDKSIAALRRWCRHVEVPLVLHASIESAPDLERRIDEPFDIDGLAAVVERDGQSVTAAALTGTPGISFYNRGILLHESPEPLLPDVEVKISDPDLGHTLSRDDVRRDAAYARAIKRAQRLVERPLRERIATAIAEHASAYARARHAGEHNRVVEGQLDTLIRATASCGIDATQLHWPLIERIVVDGRAQEAAPITRADCVANGQPLRDSDSNAVTRALAARGVRVFDGRTLTGAQLRVVPVRATDWYGAAEVVPMEALEVAERALVEEAERLLRQLGVARVLVATLAGKGSNRLFVALAPTATTSDQPILLESEHLGTNGWNKWRSTIALARSHRTFRAAVRAAAADVSLAAFVLARAAALVAGELTLEHDLSLAADVAARGGS